MKNKQKFKDIANKSSQESNTPWKNIQQEIHLKNNKAEQELESSKFFESKTDNRSKKNFPIKCKLNSLNINSHQIENKKNNIEKFCCNCTKTRCVKRYCECFSNNRFCESCNCVNCLNKYSNNYNSISKDISEKKEMEDIFCTCTKSNCIKNYCECFKSNIKCNHLCKCSNCLNKDYPIFNIKNREKENKSKNKQNKIDVYNSNSNEITNNKINIDLDDKKSNSREFSLNNDSNYYNESYQIQRISVFINEYQTLINVEIISKEDMKLIGK